MSMFRKSIASVFQGSAKAFRRFPAVMAMAIAFTLIIFVKIESNNRDIEAGAFLLDCLQWGLALGSIFALAAITFTRTRSQGRFRFIMANLAGVAVAAVAFILLYLFGGVEKTYTPGLSLSDIAISRMIVATAISLIAFISAAAYPPDVSDVSRSFFMTLKAFFVALVYGLVIGGGTAAVAAAIEALLFPAMSSTVYAYLSTIAGFLAFTIFVGYFPDFDPAAADPRRAATQDQPRFIEILCEYILIPIMLAFTLVLLAWVIRILLPGDAPLVNILSGTIGSYALVTIWLHLMVTHYESKLAAFYRRVAPFALLVIIAFSLGSLRGQIRDDGLTTEYYMFILIAVFSALSALLLIIIKKRAHLLMALLASILAVIAVLPQVGAVELPVQLQINRLEAILTEEGMLNNGELSPATEAPSIEVRSDITDAVMLLAWSDYEHLPAWFDRNMMEQDVFARSFVFSMTGFTDGPGSEYLTTRIVQPGSGLDIGDYDFAFLFAESEKGDYGNALLSSEVQGNAGLYRIVWEAQDSQVPRLTLTLDDKELFDQEISAYADQILNDFPLSGASEWEPTAEDLTYLIDTPEANVLLVFNSVMISQEPGAERLIYWFNIQQILLSED